MKAAWQDLGAGMAGSASAFGSSQRPWVTKYCWIEARVSFRLSRETKGKHLRD